MTKINLQQLIADRDAGTDEPWHVHPGNNDEYRICFTSMHNWLAEVFYDEDDPDPEADARRIARLPDLEAAYISLMTHQYRIGPLTMDRIFRAGQLENMSDMQAVLDAVEIALSAE